MDVERLEARVERCPLQELAVELPSGVYVLGNAAAKPAWWYVMHEPKGEVSSVRGLKTTLAFIEQTSPDFYAWLVRFSHGEEDGRRDHLCCWSLVQESGETSGM